MKRNLSFVICHLAFRKGFTLVELMVSIAIVGLMSAAALVNFRGGARADALRLGAREAVARIRDAQTMASTGRTTGLCRNTTDGQTDGGCSDSLDCPAGSECMALVPKGGYGAYLGSQPGENFFLFADGNGNRAYDNGEKLKDGGFSFSSPDIEIAGSDPAAPVAIVFEPPRGRAFATGEAVDVRLHLRHRVTGQTQNVRINTVSGIIEVE